jgi:hypothetical protein
MAVMSTRAVTVKGGWLQRPRSAAVAVTGFVLGLSVLASGCGGTPDPGVAHVASTKNGTDAKTSAGASGKGDPAAYSACMRKNGVANFPDPDSSGRIKLTFGRSASGATTGVDTNSPQFAKAQKACQRLLPNGGKPSAQAQQKEVQQALKLAQCMRSHGVPKYPDPQVSSDGGMQQTINPNEGVNPSSPQFQAAQKACQKLVPGSSVSEGGPPPGETP